MFPTGVRDLVSFMQELRNATDDGRGLAGNRRILLPGAGLIGKVRTPDDVPVAGAALIVQQGDRVLTAITNDRGEFELPDVVLPAVVEVRASGFASVRERVSASPATITLTRLSSANPSSSKARRHRRTGGGPQRAPPC